MKITPQDIHSQDFKRSLRGYDLDEVDSFLQQVADELEARTSENQQLKDKLKNIEAKLADYRKREQVLEKTLVTAQKMTEQMKDTSRREAAVAAAQAQAEAQKIVAEAHKQLVRFQAQIDELKRYRDAFVIRFKAFLDQQYRFLADYAKSEGTTVPKRAPAAKPAAPRAGGAKAAGRAVQEGELEIEVTGGGPGPEA